MGEAIIELIKVLNSKEVNFSYPFKQFQLQLCPFLCSPTTNCIFISMLLMSSAHMFISSKFEVFDNLTNWGRRKSPNKKGRFFSTVRIGPLRVLQSEAQLQLVWCGSVSYYVNWFLWACYSHYLNSIKLVIDERSINYAKLS